MTYDFNDVEPHQGTDLIPDGSFAKVVMTVRAGGVDGEGEHDKGLLKASNTPGSDVLSLDCEFTVAEGPHDRGFDVIDTALNLPVAASAE